MHTEHGKYNKNKNRLTESHKTIRWKRIGAEHKYVETTITGHNKNGKMTYLVKFDYMLMIQKLHDCNFAINLFQICFIKSGLVNYLYGNLKQREVRTVKI
jgi:hypothetical protein